MLFRSLEVLQEGEGKPDGLVEEEGPLLVLVRRGRQEDVHFADVLQDREIGRASCRERV